MDNPQKHYVKLKKYDIKENYFIIIFTQNV